MATLTLYNSHFDSDRSYANFIEETATGWYVQDYTDGLVYGSFSGTGITYDSYGNPVLGTITAASSLDNQGAIQWTVSNPAGFFSANSNSSMRYVLANGDPFDNYMINTILSGNDNIIGSAGDDRIYYSAGIDTINGGLGNDWIDFSKPYLSGLTIDLVAGLYKQTDNNITTTLGYLNSIENVVGSYYADVILGNSGNNLIETSKGNDTIDAGLGNDTMSYEGASYAVSVNLASGVVIEDTYYTDTLTNIENIIGSAKDDYLVGSAIPNQLTGSVGNDTLDGGSGIDTVIFVKAYRAVTVNLATGSAIGEGTDKLVGLENVVGSSYADNITGSSLANVLNGNAGNDIFNGGLGNDVLIGGLGIDQANYNTSTTNVTVNLALTTAQLTGSLGADTLIGIENLLGSSFNDTLTGDAQSNTLNGQAGNDVLNGAAGDDILIGGAGKDLMTGGLGKDSFIFNNITETAVGANRDVVTDFLHGTDKLNLSAIDANVLVAGNQAFTLIASTAAFSAPGQIKFANGILSGEVIGVGSANFEIALTGVTSVTAADFVL